MEGQEVKEPWERGLSACVPTRCPHARQWLWQEKANEGPGQGGGRGMFGIHITAQDPERPWPGLTAAALELIAQSAEPIVGCKSKTSCLLPDSQPGV